MIITFFFVCLFFVIGCSERGLKPDVGSETKCSADFQWVARGEFTAVERKKIYPPFTTEVITLVKEGKKISKGEVICELSPKDRLDRLTAQKFITLKKKLLYETESYSLDRAKDIEQNKLDIAKINTKRTLLTLEKDKRLRDWQRIIELEAALNTYELNRKLLKKKLIAKKSMVAKGFSAKLEELRLQKDLYIAQLTLAFSKSLLKYLLDHVDEQRVVKARHAYKRAKAGESVAEQLYKKNVAMSLIDLEIVSVDKKNAIYLLDKLSAEIASLTIRAERSGTALWGNTYDGTAWAKISEGAQIWPGAPIVHLISGDDRAIEFYVDQSKAGHIKIGDKIRFVPDAYPEFTLIATVYFISPVALSLPNTGDGIICKQKIKARINNYPTELRLGNSGSVLPLSNKVYSSHNSSNIYRIKMLKNHRVVSTSGDIKPSEAVNIVAPFGGKLKSVSEEGLKVNVGDEIAVMKSDEEEKKLEDISLELQKKEEELALLKKKNELGNERLKRIVQVKLGALRVAELNHSALLKSRDDDKIIKLQKDLELINEKVNLANEKLQHSKELLKKGLRSELEVSEIELEIANYIKDKIVTSSNLKLEKSGPTKTQVAISKLSIEQSKLEYQNSHQERDLNIYRNNMKYRQLELEINQKSEDKKAKTKKVKAASVKSPIDGVTVLPEVHKQGGKRGKAEVGDAVGRIVPFMRVAQMDSLHIATVVSEMDAKFIHPGQEVSISLEAYPGKEFRGWVEEVGIIATTDFEKRQDAVVDVIVSLKSKKHEVNVIPAEFKPGATCEVEFLLYSNDKALVVPFDFCVSDASGSYIVNSSGERKNVEILYSDGLNGFVLKSGLTEGAKIIELRYSL